MSLFNRKQFLISLALYFAMRLFSFYFWTADKSIYWFSETVSISILAITAYYLIKQNPLGWCIVAGEMILGGSGGFFEIRGVALRTLMLIISIIIFTAQNLSNLKIKIIEIKNANFDSIFNLSTLIFFLLAIATWSALIGIKNNHSTFNILFDLIPYFFLLYFFPLQKLITNEKFKNICFNLIIAAIIGNFITVAYVFISYNIGTFVVHDTFYWWWRMLTGGKVTALPFDYYRIVLNEHLLIAPLLCWFLYNLISNAKQKWLWIILSTILLLIFATNLTRAYFLATVVGALLLLSKDNWKNWSKYTATFTAIFILGFTTIHFTASRGQSFGLDLLFGRLQSIVTPQSEDASLSRLILLPKILEKIKSAPIIGLGLGDTVTAYSPVAKKEITTLHFDWGYLEIWAEMGLVGLCVWVLFIIAIIKNFKNRTKNFGTATQKALTLPILATLLIVNITSPAMFHTLETILIVILLVMVSV